MLAFLNFINTGYITFNKNRSILLHPYDWNVIQFFMTFHRKDLAQSEC